MILLSDERFKNYLGLPAVCLKRVDKVRVVDLELGFTVFLVYFAIRGRPQLM